MPTSKFGRALQNPSFWLAVFILSSLILGLYVFRDFGVSFDEPGIYQFAPVSIDMYSTAFDPPERPVYLKDSFLRKSGIPSNLFNYGPFYFMAVELLVRGIHTVGIQTPYWDLWHLAYFLTYEAGIVIFYLLCRRWLSGWASLGATVLFATQPLIVGHAFINPKDLPFMVFFMATIYSGLIMVDKVASQANPSTDRSLRCLPELIKSEWLAISREEFVKLRNRLVFLAGAVILLFLFHSVWGNIVQQAINSIYAAPETSPLGSVLRVFSQDPRNIPVENFIAKGQAWLSRVELLIVLFMVAGSLWLTFQLLPKSGHLISQSFQTHFHPLLQSLG